MACWKPVENRWKPESGRQIAGYAQCTSWYQESKYCISSLLRLVYIAKTELLAASSHWCHHREGPETIQSLLQLQTDAMESMDVTKRAV